jgi:hypothetical protein
MRDCSSMYCNESVLLDSSCCSRLWIDLKKDSWVVGLAGCGCVCEGKGRVWAWSVEGEGGFVGGVPDVSFVDGFEAAWEVEAELPLVAFCELLVDDEAPVEVESEPEGAGSLRSAPPDAADAVPALPPCVPLIGEADATLRASEGGCDPLWVSEVDGSMFVDCAG